MMYAIMKLSGQEYVDIYATAAKRQLAEAARQERTTAGEKAPRAKGTPTHALRTAGQAAVGMKTAARKPGNRV